MKASNRYKFVPAYWEWHLIDTEDNNKVVYNIVDPWDDDLLNCNSLDDVRNYVWEELNVERNAWDCYGGEPNYPHNALVNPFTLPDEIVDVMARALYDYYIK